MKPSSNDNLILLIVAVAAIAFLIGRGLRGGSGETSLSAGDSIAVEGHKNYGEYYGDSRARKYYNVEGRRVERFFFDPNTADSTQLLRLGLKPWIVRNIYKYRSRGGEFRKPEDFARVYGLTAGEYKSLAPYIRISADYRPASSLFGTSEEPRRTKDSLRYPVKLAAGERIVLNTADTTALKRVPGIGSGYARAIVNYRDRLGGYADVRQLLEINGVPEEALRYMELGTPDLRKIDVNRLSLDKLKRHPYINFYQARAIVEHRRLHGPLRSAADLKMIRDFSASDIERILPYISF
ncbi:MAG: helix-hairpin-helix domain-containing protein [Prevotella sp.]|uniref:ComEA family DNA-binding protein n=1 Tax=Prevotella sp. TaxID=59823 RepID=UPI002A27BD2C|nr:helix-hairpin-helix domain-containing protein [Prevotella sp.]MDD7317222.1 helix-hairpin-helix domain-containing protein [Prevotellaceae bacterium]MDY4019826.1 helix-hairpin-helix domain-containing protein [Prevotella sp.]